jgi:6-phosphogluconolactonase (cycloisomerase 2 family)
VVTGDGKNVYVTNCGSNTISSFSTNYGANLQVMNLVEATTSAGPTEIVLSNNETYLYVINSISHSISEYKKNPNMSLRSIGEISGLPANAAGLVAL